MHSWISAPFTLIYNSALCSVNFWQTHGEWVTLSCLILLKKIIDMTWELLIQFMMITDANRKQSQELKLYKPNSEKNVILISFQMY